HELLVPAPSARGARAGRDAGGASHVERALDGGGVVNQDAGREARKEVRVAAIQRQLADQPALDPLADGRGRRLNSGELLLDLDARGHVTDLEPDGEVDLVLDSEDDSVADKALESRKLGGDAVAPRDQRRENEAPVLRAHRREADVGIDVRQRQRNARHDGVGLVDYPPAECGPKLLPSRRPGTEQYQ